MAPYVNIVYWDEVCQHKDYVKLRKSMSAIQLLWKIRRFKSTSVVVVKQTCCLSLEPGSVCIDVGKDGARIKTMQDSTPYTRLTFRCSISVVILAQAHVVTSHDGR